MGQWDKKIELFRNNWGAVVCLENVAKNGQSETYAFMDRPPAVVVVLKGPQGVLLVNQYREPIGQSTWELPSGSVNPGELPIEAAKRELLEETGHLGREWKGIGSIYEAPAYSSVRLDIFSADVLVEDAECPRLRFSGEISRAKWFSFEEYSALASHPSNLDCSTVACLALAKFS